MSEEGEAGREGGGGGGGKRGEEREGKGGGGGGGGGDWAGNNCKARCRETDPTKKKSLFFFCSPFGELVIVSPQKPRDKFTGPGDRAR